MMQTSIHNTASRYQSPGIAVRLLMFAVALGGLAVSAFLLYHGVQKRTAIPGCGSGSGCDEVLNSEWSVIFGLPTALPAVTVYVIVSAALLHIGGSAPASRQRGAWLFLIPAAPLLAGAGIWFSFLQYFVIGAFCKYCMAAHVCGVALAALILFHAPVGRRKLLPDDSNDPLLIAPTTALGLMLIALLAIGALAGVQGVFKPSMMTVVRSGDFGPLPQDTDELTYIRIANNRSSVQLNRKQLPVIGSPSARVMIVYVFDYTCPHCRNMHATLERLIQQWEGRLAVMTLPAPLNSGCNPHVTFNDHRHAEACSLARTAMSVWRADASKFEAFDRWLFESYEPRSAQQALTYAREMIGAGAFDAVWNSDWPDRALQQGVSLYGQADGGSIPILLVREFEIRGQGPDQLEQLLRDKFQLAPEQ